MTALLPSITLALATIIGLIFIGSLVIETRDGAGWKTILWLLLMIVLCLALIHSALDVLGA